jgi:hypothetical protein
METEIIGRLNGIAPPPGTIIGFHPKHLRFMAVDISVYDGDPYCIIRWATAEEIDRVKFKEPNSYVEFRAIPRRMTPYGPARVFGSIRVKPKPSPRKRNLRPGGYSIPPERNNG